MKPKDIQLVGSTLVIAWQDGTESYYEAEFLRKHSPSAENIGERDILGNQHGGNGPKQFPGIQILGWQFHGNYAFRPTFSDGHASGLYSWEYLRELNSRRTL